jgi:hypothetical protein
MSEEIEVSKQWIAKAKNDLLNADNNLKAEECATPNYTGMKHTALVEGK